MNNKVLEGVRVFVGRAAANDNLGPLLGPLGARVHPVACVELVPLQNGLAQAKAALGCVDLLVLTSKQAVRLLLTDFSVGPNRPLMAVVGRATANEAIRLGWPPDLVGDGTGAMALLGELVQKKMLAGKSILYPASELADQAWADEAVARGATSVCLVPVYGNRAPAELDGGLLTAADVAVFYSPSAATHLAAIFDGGRLPAPVDYVAVGPTTAGRLKELGAVHLTIAPGATPNDILTAVVNCWQNRVERNPS